MKLLLRAPEEKLKAMSRLVSGVEFVPFSAPAGEGCAAVVVQGSGFSEDLAAAVSFGVPVVVVAGCETVGADCIAQALFYGVPGSCILIKKGDDVCSYDGKRLCPAHSRGIGVQAVVLAAEQALEKGLYPEVLVWEEPDEMLPAGKGTAVGEAVEAPAPGGQGMSSGNIPVAVPAGKEETASVSASERGARQEAKEAAPDALEFGAVLDLAERVVAVFRVGTCSSGGAAKKVADALGGVHLELSPEPMSFALYGRTPEEAVASEKYMFSDGASVKARGFLGAKWLVVEADTGVAYPEALNVVHDRAEKVIHVVGDIEEGKTMVEAFTVHGWKLDAVVAESPGIAEKVRRAFGSLFCPDPAVAVGS